jgi:hypothetical protein
VLAKAHGLGAKEETGPGDADRTAGGASR